MIGTRISHYRIVRELGIGGMGEVYLAEDETLHRNVALKLLPAEFTSDSERVHRFHQEARAASALSHPNIITIYEIGQAEGRHFIATEFIDGPTLRQRVSGRPLTVAEVLDTAIGVATALVAAHEAGIVHRDIKPENVMVRNDGIVKVLDFGLAKLTEGASGITRKKSNAPSTDPGLVMGTVHYMSPEQLRGQPVDARTDIFSLGEVMYEMVTGNSPFDGPSTSEVIAAILERDPEPMARFSRSTPEQLQRIVSKSLQKDRERRYQSARDLLNDLRNLKEEIEYARRSRTASGPAFVMSQENDEEAIFARDTDPHFRPGEQQIRRKTSGTSYILREIRANRDVVAGALLLVAIILGAYYYFSRSKPSYDSIAVLPFVNSDNDASIEYLSDGISESIIHSLSQLPKLQVMAQSSVFRYKGHQADPRVVGRELGVRAVLMGKIRQQGDTLLIQADLVDTERGVLLWGEQYNRRMSDILAVQSDIAQEITDKLRLRLTGEERARVAKQYTRDHEAYQLYLKGRFQWNKRTEESLRSAIGYFDQAIAREPTYALAYAGLADCYSLLSVYSRMSPAESFPRAKAAAQRALELDESLAEAHTSLAWAHFNYDWNWPASEREFRRAIDLNPNYATAHQWYSLYLSAMGRHDEALREIRKALDLDPLSMAINTGVGTTFYLAGRYPEAMEQFKKTLDLEPGFRRGQFELARLQELRGMCAEALPTLEKLSEDGTAPFQAALARAYARCGKREEAELLVKRLIEREKTSYVNPYEIAAVYEALGDRDATFTWLNRALADHITRLVYLNVEPMFTALHGEPRFEELRKKMGLAK